MNHDNSASRPQPGRPRALVIAAAALGITVVAALYWRYSHPRTLIDQLAAQQLPRTAVSRLSGETRHHPCVPRSGTPLVPSAECANLPEIVPSERLLRHISAVAESGVPDGIHADVLVDLALTDSAYTALPSVIERLQGLAETGEASANALADLSAALLIRAGRLQTPLDVIVAEEMAEEAVKRDSLNLTGLFNRALALETITADSAAADAWKTYLAVERDSAWAAEARMHLRKIRWTPQQKPPAPTSDSALVALAATYPLRARNYGWDKLLGQWGAAILHGRMAEADSALRRAEVLGGALESRRRDASLADAVRAIRKYAPESAETRRLARVHDLFAKGREAVVHVNYSAADSLLSLAYSLRTSSPCLNAWIAINLAPARQHDDPDEAVRLIDSALALDSTRYPALAGKALLTLGAIRLKDIDEKAALEAKTAALPLLRRSGEAEMLAEALVGVADIHWMEKDVSQALHAGYEAAAVLQKSPESETLHILWALMATWAAQDGYSNAALRLHDEDLAVARQSGLDLMLTEAHDLRAEALAQDGEVEAAQAEIDSAAPLLQRLDPKARAFFSLMFGATRGIVSVNVDPRAAEARLSAAMPMLPSAGVPLRRITALLARADARAALGLTDSARADSQRALELLDSARAHGSGGLSRGLSHRVRSTLNAVVVRLVAEGKAQDALQLLDAGAAALRYGYASGASYQMPAGEVGVRYAIVRDTVFAWTVSGHDVHVTTSAVPARDLEDRVRRAGRALAQRDDDAARPELRALYEWLIRPIQRDLAPGSELVIVPDGVLAGVPWVALRDERARRYLVEQHSLRVALSLADSSAAAAPVPATGSGMAVVVTDPAFDRQLYPNLRPLRGAREEVESVAWPVRRIMLSGADARADTLVRLLPRASILHFAGHAVADEYQPDSSFLVLAPERGHPETGRLTAAAVAEMNLHRLDLVVLSACSTLNDARGGGGGFSGLGGAFLNAGARGVIGSLWAVDDERTGKLMRRFYAEYEKDHEAAAALRRAQLGMLNGDPGDRDPSAWAGFEYAGR